MRVSINRGISRVIGEVLGASYNSHRRIDALFHESGFGGDPPLGNCSDKITSWICREADVSPDDIVAKVGRVLCEFMDSDHESHNKGRVRICGILAQSGLSYSHGGHIFGSGVSAPAKSLDDLLRKQAIPEIEVEFQRALESVESDPPAAVTAACAILEAFCRIYLQEEGVSAPVDLSAKPLWNAVSHHIGFAPATQTDYDIKKILSGFLSVVDGIACFRTHDGSAHGKERRNYRIFPRHARLAVHAAHTLVLFGLETWADRKTKMPKDVRPLEKAT
jgi:hypothetical protein